MFILKVLTQPIAHAPTDSSNARKLRSADGVAGVRYGAVTGLWHMPRKWLERAYHCLALIKHQTVLDQLLI